MYFWTVCVYRFEKVSMFQLGEEKCKGWIPTSQKSLFLDSHRDRYSSILGVVSPTGVHSTALLPSIRKSTLCFKDFIERLPNVQHHTNQIKLKPNYSEFYLNDRILKHTVMNLKCWNESPRERLLHWGLKQRSSSSRLHSENYGDIVRWNTIQIFLWILNSTTFNPY